MKSKKYPSNTLLSLPSTGKGWLIKKGAINLYAITASQQGLGHRRLLAHFPEGSFLFSWGIDFENFFQIKGVSEGKIEVQEYSLEALETKKLSVYLEEWVRILSSLLEVPFSERSVEHIPQEGAVTLAEGSLFQIQEPLSPTPKHPLCWIYLFEGNLSLLQREEISLVPGDLFPMPAAFWGKAQIPSIVEVLPTKKVIKKGAWQNGLYLFHELLLYDLSIKSELSELQEKKRTLEKQEQDRLSLTQTFTEMAALLDVEQEPLLPFSKDPLYLALEIVAKEMRMSLASPKNLPPEAADKKVHIKVGAICEASYIRQRQIRLEAKWWLRDSDPFLGFFGKKKQPTAVLNVGHGVYEMVDPVTLNRRKITAEIAQEFDPIGYGFFRPFPETLTTGKEVIKFCFERQWREYAVLVLCATIGAFLSLIAPTILPLLYSKVIPDANLPLLFQLVLLLAFAAISATVFSFFRSLMLIRIQEKSTYEVQAAFWDKLLKLPAKFFHRYSSGDLFFRTTCLEDIRTLLSTKGAQAILSGIFSFLYLVAMIAYSVNLTLWTCGLLLFVGTLVLITAHFKIRLEKKISILKTKTNGALTQFVGAISKLRVSGSEPSAFSYWASQFTQRKKLEIRAQSLQNRVTIINGALPFLSMAIIFLIAIHLQKQGTLDIRDFLGFDAAFVLFSFALFDLANTLLEMTPVVSFWETAKVILEEPEEISRKKKSPGSLTGRISLDQVFFHYETYQPLLKGISLQIAPGEFVGIVGASGSGKSTLLRLILNFEKPISGAVFFDGKDLATLNPYEVRKQLGVVLQDTGVFAGSFFDNIVCGGLFPKEDIERALELSGFKEDMKNFPMGLHTIITSGGETLSGGQKQRLLIARALIARPKILIFDEATSALDNKTQDKISTYIDQLHVTRVVIAHRLSTLKNADKIYVLDKGIIAQTGTFDGLAHEKGIFQEMLSRQLL